MRAGEPKVSWLWWSSSKAKQTWRKMIGFAMSTRLIVLVVCGYAGAIALGALLAWLNGVSLLPVLGQAGVLVSLIIGPPLFGAVFAAYAPLAVPLDSVEIRPDRIATHHARIPATSVRDARVRALPDGGGVLRVRYHQRGRDAAWSLHVPPRVELAELRGVLDAMRAHRDRHEAGARGLTRTRGGRAAGGSRRSRSTA